MKVGLLNATHMTPIERKMGRFMKAPDGHGDAGGDSGGAADNTGVNPDSTSGAGEGNTGQEFDYGQFWNNNQSQGDSDDSSSDPTEAGAELGRQLVSQIQSFSASEVFTPEAIQKMADGDLTPLNAGINKAVQSSMTQMLTITATLLQRMEQHMQAQFDNLVEDRLQSAQTSQQDESMLRKEFKGFEDPAMRPVIHGVFRQALQHSNGDRQKALQLTRGMLKTMGTRGVEDMGLSNMRNPDDGLDEGPARLVRELLQGM